jgi:hypothetical protein
MVAVAGMVLVGAQQSPKSFVLHLPWHMARFNRLRLRYLLLQSAIGVKRGGRPKLLIRLLIRGAECVTGMLRFCVDGILADLLCG